MMKSDEKEINDAIKGIQDMDSNLNGMDGGFFTSTIKESFSFKAHLFGTDFEIKQMLIYVVIMIVCVAIQVYAYSKTYKK